MNLIAIVVVALLNIALGMVWYSNTVFGKVWLKLTGKKKMEGTGQSYALGALSSLMTSFALAVFIVYMNANNIAAGAFAGFLAWAGFVATVTLGSVIWEGRPAQLWLLNNAYNLLSYIVMGAILAVWA